MKEKNNAGISEIAKKREEDGARRGQCDGDTNTPSAPAISLDAAIRNRMRIVQKVIEPRR